MISYMVLGGPRSGTTWAANWLTTDTTHCIHDPLLEYTPDRLNNLSIPGVRLGVACTALLMYPEWIQEQKCPKIIIYRNVAEINHSLRELGLDELGEISHLARIDAFKGSIPIFAYEQLFLQKYARRIAEILKVPFDPHRHALLSQMNIQPQWSQLHVGKEAALQLVQRIREAR